MTLISDVEIGSGFPKIMGILNVSPESFYKNSIKLNYDEISRFAKKIENDGADLIDIGAMSTAPYLKTLISSEEEISRIKVAIKAVKNNSNLPISIDTPRASVAEVAIRMGIDAINDVCGLKYDPKMSQVISKSNLPTIIGAYSNIDYDIPGTIISTKRILKNSISIALNAGIKTNKIIVDPSIGFFRNHGQNPFFTLSNLSWYLRDIDILYNLRKLKILKSPICISVSRKSFIGKLFNLETEDRLIPSIVSEIISIINGASLVRTHDVKETSLAITTASLIRDIA
ncbi:MAG: dihydropteroate synthase [Nitrososphaeraceae archaeon]